MLLSSWFDSLRRSPHRAVVAIEVGVSLLLFGVFLCFRDLPLVDLPQHALQITNWLRLDGPSRPPELELNLRTPYLLAYPLARALAPLVGPVVALKLVIWASIAGQFATFHGLCARLRHDPYLSLLGIPLALGYGFLFGFVSFVAAMPLLYLSLIAALNHGEAPTWKRGVALASVLSLTLVAHGVAFALACVAVPPLLLRRDSRIASFAPLLAPVALYAIWIVPGSSAKRIGGDHWDLGWSRLHELPGLLVGIGGSDPAATLGGVALLALALLGVGPLHPNPSRILPLALALVGYVFFPSLFRGVGPLGPRFAVLIVPSLLLATLPRASPPPCAHAPAARRSVHHATLVAFVLGWCLLFSVRLASFNRETQSFHALVERLPENLRVRPLVFDRTSPAFPGVPTLIHFPAYYTVEKGGAQGYSFAMYPLSVVRYRPHIVPTMGGGAEWRPETFDAASEIEHYDYYLVKSTFDRGKSLFERFEGRVVLDAHVGDWWGYRSTLSGDGAVARSP
jgi:hypothetical protein